MCILCLNVSYNSFLSDQMVTQKWVMEDNKWILLYQKLVQVDSLSSRKLLCNISETTL